jgi:glutamate-ammonia-ligase adenylyltransferase
MVQERSTGLSELAGSGFIDLDKAQQNLTILSQQLGQIETKLLEPIGSTQNPDQCLELLVRLARDHSTKINSIAGDEDALGRLCKLLGASVGLFEFLVREPSALKLFSLEPTLPTAEISLVALTKAANGVSEIS